MNNNWNKDFKHIPFPSIDLFIESKSIEQNVLNVVICQSIDEYPKYLVKFEDYLAFKSHEETGVDLSEEDIINGLKKANSLVMESSDWIDSCHFSTTLFPDIQLSHYLFSGGDHVVEVLATSEPQIEIINSQTMRGYIL